MSRKEKAAIIEGLQEVISECSVGIFTDYRGLTAAEITALRRKLDEGEIRLQVVKNSLARAAAEKAGRGDIVEAITGPIAIAFGFGDAVAPAKIISEYIRKNKSTLAIRGGFLDNVALTEKDVESLAKMPPKEILIGMVLAGMQSPIYGLVFCVSSPLRSIMGVLQARIKQLEGA